MLPMLKFEILLFFSKNFIAKNLTLKNSLKCTLGLIVNIFIYRLAECTVHSCHVHIMLDSLSGGSLEPAVTSLETLQACCNFLWNNSGMSIIIVIFSFHFIGAVPAFCSQASSCNFVMPIFYKLVLFKWHKTVKQQIQQSNSNINLFMLSFSSNIIYMNID